MWAVLLPSSVRLAFSSSSCSSFFSSPQNTVGIIGAACTCAITAFIFWKDYQIHHHGKQVPRSIKEKFSEDFTLWMEKELDDALLYSPCLFTDNDVHNHTGFAHDELNNSLKLPLGGVVDENWKSYLCCSEIAQSIIKSLQQHEQLSYLHPLPGKLPAVPQPLIDYMKDIINYGPLIAASRLYDDTIITPPKHIRQYISGSTNKALRFRDKRCGSYFASVFHQIQNNSCTPVHLAGWDLYHGHMFLNVYENPSKEQSPDAALYCDLGIIFHAKEFPVEYRKARNAFLYAIGSKEMKGSKDPRLGTKHSILDKQFPMRNYIWLLSVNKIFVFDLEDPKFPQGIIGNQEFSTIDEGFFSKKQLGDINYFPGLFSKNDISFTRKIPKSENTLRSKKILNTGQLLGHLKKNVWNRWYGEQIVNLIALSTSFADDVLACPRDAFSPEMMIKNHLWHIENIIKRLPQADLTQLERNLNLPSPNPLNPLKTTTTTTTEQQLTVVNANRNYIEIPEGVKPYLSSLLEVQLIESKRKIQQNNQNVLSKLIKDHPSLTPSEAEEVMEVTKDYLGQYSLFRAQNLLELVKGECRSEENKKKYGIKDHPLELGMKVWKMVLYATMGLEVFKIMQERLLTLEDAVKEVTDEKKRALNIH